MTLSTQIYDVEEYVQAVKGTILPTGLLSIIEYQDLQSIPDNSQYIPDLAPGQLQPLEDNHNVDELFKDVNFELLRQLITEDNPQNVNQKNSPVTDPD